MKKSEKQKGKTAVAERKKRNLLYIVAAAAVVVILAAGFYLFYPTAVKNGDTVKVYYTGSFDNGTVFDSNLDREPLIFTIGNHTVITGMEEAVIGMTVNSTKTVHIPADKAYGPYRQDLIQVVNRSILPGDVEPVAGHVYSIRRTADGAVAYVRLIGFNKSTLTIDQNHLLAGQNLTFTIRFAGFYH